MVLGAIVGTLLDIDGAINRLGGWVENGECPWDPEWLGQLVKDISYNNAVQYFGFELETI